MRHLMIFAVLLAFASLDLIFVNFSDSSLAALTFAVFWLLTALALVGAVLGFIWTRTGALEAVLVGGLVVTAQSLLSWAKVCLEPFAAFSDDGRSFWIADAIGNQFYYALVMVVAAMSFGRVGEFSKTKQLDNFGDIDIHVDDFGANP